MFSNDAKGLEIKKELRMNLIKKILDVIKNNKSANEVLDDIKERMSKISKNLSHPLIDSEGKNKLLKVYTNLADVEKSLY